MLKDQQALDTAQQALAAATLRSPITGTVGAVGLTAGQQASTAQSIVIVDSETALVTVTVPLAQLGLLRTGQSVAVAAAGATKTLDGVVQSIGVLPTSTTSTSPSFPVVVAVSDAPMALATNSLATATITLATAHDAVTVPVSAVSGLSGGQSQVTVLSGGQQKTVSVAVGAVGQGLAQITTGVSAGQLVVLADPSQPLPTANLFGGRGGGVGGSGLSGGYGGSRTSGNASNAGSQRGAAPGD